MATLSEAAHYLLLKGNYIAAEETASAEDQEWAESVLTATIRELQARKFKLWGTSTSVIPMEFLDALCDRVLLSLGQSFGSNNVVEANNAVALVERRLRELATVPATGAVQQATYY